MIKHYKHNQINKKKWDKCISNSKENIIYAFSWYLDCVSPFWEAFILENNNEYNEYLAVMPLPVKKKYGISFIQVPLFAQQLGVFSTQKLSSLEFKAFLTLLQKQFKLVSNYPFNTTNYEDFKSEFEEIVINNDNKLKQNLKKHKTHHLSLQQNYSAIRQNYKKDTKYRINQAQKQNFESIQKTEIDDIELLYQFFEESVFLENGISNQAKPILKSLFKILKEKELAELYYIQSQDKAKQEIQSGILFVKNESVYDDIFTTKWIYLFNATNKAAKTKDESRRWFLDKFIQQKSNQLNTDNFENQSYKTSLIQVLDFESAQEREVARFYSSFGSEEKAFFVLDYNHLPFYIKSCQKIIHLIRQFISK